MKRQPKLLDLFCGRGGWSKGFAAAGWYCIGVDWEHRGYPFDFILGDCREVDAELIASCDAVVMSPPCEDFARAWLPWLRADQSPSAEAVGLLRWSVKIAQSRPRAICECSRFASRSVPGAFIWSSYALWGDVPALMPEVARTKTSKSGKDPAKRAEIPVTLATWIARVWTQSYEAERLV